MKKAILLALVSAAFCASADDQYFYWMIDDDAKIGENPIPTSDKPYSAQVGYIDGSGQSQYFNLYTADGSLRDLGQAITISDIHDNVPMFAKIAGSLGENTSFFIELLNDAHVVAHQGFSYSDITPFLSAVDGMATPAAGSYHLGQFAPGPVPEPTSGLLMLVGLAGLALRRKNKKA